MAVIVTRTSKGTALTTTELDANFTNLNTELASKILSTANPTFTGAVTFTDPTGIVPAAINYPAAAPSLMLDFLNTEKLDSRVTFSRTGVSTRINADGLVETISANLPRFDYDPLTFAPKGLLIEEARTNLLLNTEYFPAWGSSNASVIADAVISPNGTQTGNLLTITAAGGGISQVTQAFTAGSAVTVSVFAKRGTSNFLRFELGNLISCWFNLSTGAVASNGAGSGNVVFTSKNIQAYSNGWYRCSLTVTTSTITTLGVAVYATDTDGNPASTNSSTYIWGIQAETGLFATSYVPAAVTHTGRASAGTYIDNTGTLQTATSGVARFQYSLQDLNLAPYLLLEPSRTNSIRNNMMTGAVAGTPGTAPTNWAIGGNAGLSYQVVGTGTDSGITYIDIRFFGTVASVATPEVYINFENNTATSAAQTQTWTASCYAKIVAGTQTGILDGELFILGYSSTPSLSEASSTVFPYSLLTNTFRACRFFKTFTFTNSTTVSVTPRLDVNFTAGGGSVVNFTLRIGMPQLELGSSATSVIATTTAAATRAADTSTSSTSIRGADTADLTNINSWYNQTEWSIFAQYDSLYSGSVTTNGQRPHVWGLNNSTLSGFDGYGLVERWDTTTRPAFHVRHPSSSITSIALANYSAYIIAGQVYKAVTAMNSSQLAVTVDNKAIVTITNTGYGISTQNRLQIGFGDTGGSLPYYLNGHIQRLAYYPTRLTDAEMQLLTT